MSDRIATANVADLIVTPAVGQIERMVQDVPGWSPLDQLAALFYLAYGSDVEGDIIELGSWCGRSTTALGLAAKLSGHSVVHAIDLFPERSDWRRNEDGSHSLMVTLSGTEIRAYQEQTVWAEPFDRDIAPVYEAHHSVLAAFEETIARNGLNDVVRPFRGSLDMFAAAAPRHLRCKLAFIDGDHSYDAVCHDIHLVERFLAPGGWVCFDDAFSSYEGVDRAIREEVIDSGRYDRFQQVTRKCFVARRTRR
ncbi:MAG TPA: class I SAM-dependent methyltransferase [Vicinamibacterales bacterium]|nr:class I SAM-dependent methyltransferase [Vicinamibacterales bacterium]